MPWLLKVTHTCTHEVNLAGLDPMYPLVTSEPLDRILGRGGGQMARDAESWLIEQFEKHEGSQYGEKLFPGRADDDRGVELVWEDD